MKKIILAIAIMLGALSAEAITIEEFFKQAKLIEGADYTKISKVMLAIVKRGVKSVELIELENLSDSVSQNLFALCDEISLDNDVSLIKQDEGNEKFRVWMQTEDENFKMLLFNVETEDGKSDCDIAFMVADKKLMEDIKFKKMK